MLRQTAILLLLAQTVAAQPGESPQVAEGRARFDIATRHYNDGDYALSLQEFTEVRNLLRQAQHPRAELLGFNIGRCYEQLGRDAEAIDAYQTYLNAPAAARDESRADAEQRLRELRARVALRG